MADPTSWFTIESGWDVQDRAGTVIGEVTEVVGDEDADIFDGLCFGGEDGEEHFGAAARGGGGGGGLWGGRRRGRDRGGPRDDRGRPRRARGRRRRPSRARRRRDPP